MQDVTNWYQHKPGWNMSRKGQKELNIKLDHETSLLVQILRLHTANAGGKGSIPCQGTEVSQVVWLAKG